MIINPHVIDRIGNSERSYDLYSRLLVDSIVMICGTIEEDLMTSVNAQLLYLNNIDPEKRIQIFINSYGGSISAGLSTYDVIQYISNPITVIGQGCCASMGAFLLSAKYERDNCERLILPNTKVMIHSAAQSGIGGRATDVMINARELEKTQNKMVEMISKFSGQSLEKVKQDCERDYWLDAKESVEYGLVDKIITSKPRL
jgi:ATP-dependent Clp protease protease subunit